MQMVFVPELPPSGNYGKVVTTKDVYSNKLFAYTMTNGDIKKKCQHHLKHYDPASLPTDKNQFRRGINFCL